MFLLTGPSQGRMINIIESRAGFVCVVRAFFGLERHVTQPCLGLSSIATTNKRLECQSINIRYIRSRYIFIPLPTENRAQEEWPLSLLPKIYPRHPQSCWWLELNQWFTIKSDIYNVLALCIELEASGWYPRFSKLSPDCFPPNCWELVPPQRAWCHSSHIKPLSHNTQYPQLWMNSRHSTSDIIGVFSFL